MATNSMCSDHFPQIRLGRRKRFVPYNTVNLISISVEMSKYFSEIWKIHGSTFNLKEKIW